LSECEELVGVTHTGDDGAEMLISAFRSDKPLSYFLEFV